MERHNEIELDLRELSVYLKKRIWIIATSVVLCSVLGFFISVFLIPPQYTASTRIYVLNRTNESNVVYADIQVSAQLLDDYPILITGQNVTREVVRRLGLSQTPGRLAKQLKVTSPNDTHILQIDVTDTDPQMAAAIANCVRQVATEQIQEVTDTDSVKLVYEAAVPEEPSSPHVWKNTMIAFAVGLFPTVFVLVVMFMLDDTIRTEKDVERYLHLDTLGAIPLSKALCTSGQQGTEYTLTAKRRGARSWEELQ